MARNGGRQTPLVADRRYPAATAPAAKPERRGRSRRERAPARRRPRGPVGWVLGLLGGILWFFWRIIWGVGWRVGMVFAVIIGLAVGYYAVQLPPVDQLVDGRARGSVTLLDRYGEVFAWRGEQFGG